MASIVENQIELPEPMPVFALEVPESQQWRGSGRDQSGRREPIGVRFAQRERIGDETKRGCGKKETEHQ
jgi:hypothetical protein